MLTGCVNATTSTTDNSKADKQATEVSEEQKSESIQEENTHETEASASLEVQEYHDWQGIDMPFPQGWEVDDIINRTGMICLTGGTESDPVYYGIEFTYDSNYQDQSNGLRSRNCRNIYFLIWIILCIVDVKVVQIMIFKSYSGFQHFVEQVLSRRIMM